MEPLRLCLALGPLGLYFLVLGGLHLGRRPVVISGARDQAALYVALTGLILVGPIELLFPQDAIVWFGPSLFWAMLLSVYGLCLSLAVLLAPPSLTIYNITPQRLWPLLTAALDTLDPQTRWAGNCASSPRLGIELHIEPHWRTGGVSLVSTGQAQQLLAWRALETALADRLAGERARSHVLGWMLVGAGTMLLARVGWDVVFQSAAIAASWGELLAPR